MPIFEYKGLNESGASVSGMLDADTPKEARSKLRRDNILVTSITQTTSADSAAPVKFGIPLRIPFLRRRVNVRDLAMFTRQLATLLQSGIPMADGLNALIDQCEDRAMESVLRDVREKITQGMSLADAMELHPNYFNELYVNMVRAGEASGAMETVLKRLAEFLQKQGRLQAKISAALAYPVIMVCVGVMVVAILLTWVVPKITKLLISSKQELPVTTKILVNTSNFVKEWWWTFIVAFFAISALYRMIVSKPAGRLKVDTLKLRLPVLGDMMKKTAVSRFALTLSTLLKSGIPALRALRITRNIVSNELMGQTIDKVHDRIVEGTDIATPLQRSGVFPPVVAYMIAVGEQSGELDEVLVRLAEAYDEEVEISTQRALSLLEPILIISLATVVGFIMFSIIMPILKLSQIA